MDPRPVSVFSDIGQSTRPGVSEIGALTLATAIFLEKNMLIVFGENSALRILAAAPQQTGLAVSAHQAGWTERKRRAAFSYTHNTMLFLVS
jgi:hypothetical protein